jgi:hypothetical protein
MNQSLLIAHGDAGLCDAYRRFFINAGHDVQAADDGLDCLETGAGDAGSACATIWGSKAAPEHATRLG